MPAWPATLPQAQALRQKLTKSPTIAETGQGNPINRKLINPKAPTHVEMVFFLTMCQLKTIMEFYQIQLAGGVRPVVLNLNTENGFAAETVFLTLKSVEKVSDSHCETHFTGEIKHRAIT